MTQTGFIPAIALAAIAFGSYTLHASRTYSEPEASIQTFFESASGGELNALQRGATEEWMASFVKPFGDAKHQAVTQAYNRVARLGLGRWRELRRRAEDGARTAFYQLRERTYNNGGEALRRLPPDEGFRLIQDYSALEDFRWTAGFGLLPAADQQRAGSADALRYGRDFDGFIEREAWTSLPDADRAELGAAAAISSHDTPEKLAYLDRIGMAIVDKPTRDEIGSITRAELADAEAFKFKYGWPLAEAYLKRGTIPKVATVGDCDYPAAQMGGNLFKGTFAACTATTATQSGSRTVSFTLERVDRTWLVSGTSPMPYEVW